MASSYEGMTPSDSSWAQHALDSVPAEIAVLNSSGNIIYVNREWRRFGEANSAPHAFLGHNYLEVCRAANDPTANAVAAALTGLLSGALSHYTCEYPCDTPDGHLWFRMILTATSHLPERHIIVQHIDITDRIEAEQRLRQIYSAVAEGIVVTDGNQQIISVNPAAENLFAQPESALLGQRLDTLLPLPPAEPGRRCRVSLHGLSLQAACFSFADRRGRYHVWTLTELPLRLEPPSSFALDQFSNDYLALLAVAPKAASFDTAPTFLASVSAFVTRLHQSSISPSTFMRIHSYAIQRSSSANVLEEARLLALHILTELGALYHSEISRP
jgi:PAS domain S-box-containing protein